MLGSRTDLHIFDAGSVNGTRYCNEIHLPYVRLLEALWVCNGRQCTMSSHSSFLESEDIELIRNYASLRSAIRVLETFQDVFILDGVQKRRHVSLDVRSIVKPL
ncbi:hypothetical protein TNCV_74041 [Trichonephila clavipes]|nr:hypothetical protein TNCV_74041 [Trichonephila clavipes]